MASQEVIIALDTLHKELEKLVPAIRHVEAAQEVTNSVKGLPLKYTELLKKVEETDRQHKNELTNAFSSEVEKLVLHNKRQQQEYSAMLAAQKELNTAHKNDLQAAFERELAMMTEENEKLQANTQKIQQQVAKEHEALLHVKGAIKSFHQRIAEINFPERLDKVDANVAGIMAAVQSVQNRLDNLDRSLSGHFRESLDFQKETRSALQASIQQSHEQLKEWTEKFANKQRTSSYITWLLIAISALAIYLLK